MAEINKVSPLAVEFSVTDGFAGLDLKTYGANWHYRGRDDLSAFIFGRSCAIAGVFTSSKACGAPIDWNCGNLAAGERVRAIIINAGNANAFTGSAGDIMCRTTAEVFAAELGCKASEIWLASTGVIGVKPTADYVSTHAGGLLASEPTSWKIMAESIMTTDTFPKGYSRRVELFGELITITGIAKGSGMIAPDLATMLSFIVTDAPLPQRLLQSALEQAVAVSFNCISVDSDTSTSDMVLLVSTAESVDASIDEFCEGYGDFVLALRDVCVYLARLIVCDGEGASKLITVHVRGAVSDADAKRVGLSIGNSPLVKTAIAGADANWGRVVMAIGKSGAEVSRDDLDIDFGNFSVARGGEASIDFDEVSIASYMLGQEIDIFVDLHVGAGSATIWSCDLTHEYIRINADYRS